MAHRYVYTPTAIKPVSFFDIEENRQIAQQNCSEIIEQIERVKLNVQDLKQVQSFGSEKYKMLSEYMIPNCVMNSSYKRFLNFIELYSIYGNDKFLFFVFSSNNWNYAREQIIECCGVYSHVFGGAIELRKKLRFHHLRTALLDFNFTYLFYCEFI